VNVPAVNHASELNNREWANYICMMKTQSPNGGQIWHLWLRLDVAPEVDAEFWQAFRQELKAVPWHPANSR